MAAVAPAVLGLKRDGAPGITDGGVMFTKPRCAKDDVMCGGGDVEAYFFFVVTDLEDEGAILSEVATL